ncbi:Peptidoglycan binding-like domain-containing protein [Methylorubrum aminovorans]
MTVAEIRRALLARGYAVDADGGLDAAIRAFQRDAGLKQDGDVGPRTRAAFARPIAAKPSGMAAPIGGMADLVKVARLRRFEPFAREDILVAIAASAPAIEAAGITTPKRLAHFLAQVAHESAGLARTEEALSYSAARMVEVWPSRFPTAAAAVPYARNPQALANKVYGGRLGNRLPGDGWRFRGGGGLGTTGRANYAEAGFEADPDALRRPENFLAPALLYWRTRGCNALADRDDVVGITVKINGGKNGLADRRKRLAAAERVFAA